MVQTMIQESMKSAVDGATQVMLRVMEEKLAAQSSRSTAMGASHYLANRGSDTSR